MRLRRAPVGAPPRDIDALREIDLHLYGRLCDRDVRAPGLRPIPGQITEREARVLHDLAANVWDGEGNVLELGTLFGASTQWLGLGAAANAKRRGRLIAADAFLPYFSAGETDAQLEPLLGDRADWPAIAADFELVGFRRAFEALHSAGQPYSDFLEIRRCLVPSVPGESSAELEEVVRAAAPIGLLVVDSVKSWHTVRALAVAVIEQLRPGALVAWQDERWFTYAISFLNERIGGSTELLAVADSMHVYRYAGGLDADAVRALMPETVEAVGADALRELYRERAWRSYLGNDAHGVLSATLQLALALADVGARAEGLALFEAARLLPGFGGHAELFDLAARELGASG
jgi:hypothetical protein